METNDSGAPLSGRRCQPIDGGQDYEALRLDAPPLSPSPSVPPPAPPLFFLHLLPSSSSSYFLHHFSFLLLVILPLLLLLLPHLFLFFLLLLPLLSLAPPPLLMETLQGEVFWTAGASGSDAGVPSSEGWEQTQAGTTSDSPLGSSCRQKKKKERIPFLDGGACTTWAGRREKPWSRK